jgi:acetyltransferase-like isoleucine patch superfamily enzyme
MKMAMVKLLRSLINLLDWILWRLWIFRFKTGYKMWGSDFQQRQLSQAPMRYLKKILDSLGAGIDPTAVIKTGLFIDNLENGLNGLRIGTNAYIGPGVFFDLAAPVTIEAEAVVAPRVMILTHGDVGQRMLAKFIKRDEGPVLLKNGCWIGAGATILPGITVGKAAIVGAGAIVTHDVPDFTIVAGNPAREIRKTFEVTDEYSD